MKTKVISKKFLLVLSLLILFTSTKSLSANNKECTFIVENYLQDLRKLENVISLEIKIYNSKKWIKNSYNLLKSFNNKLNLQEKRKKHRAKIKVIYNFGECSYNAKLSQNGDFNDHINIENNGKISRSLKIKILNNENIAGFTKFKLLLPKTRNFENEIIFTDLLQHFGILSPKTRYLNVKINGHEIKYIFQEEIGKELLERNGKPEGPIFREDESLVFFDHREWVSSMRKYTQPIIINKNWIIKNNNTIYQSLTAYKRLFEFYETWKLQYWNTGKKNIDIIIPNNLLFNNNKAVMNDWVKFELLMLSADAFHGLSLNDRRYYWNIFEQSFEPIYNDGDVKFNLIKSIPLELSDDLKKIINIEDCKKLIQLLSTIDISDFKTRLASKNVNLEEKDLAVKIDNMITNLNYIQNFLEKKQNNKENFTVNLIEKLYDLKEFYFVDLSNYEMHQVNIDKKNDILIQNYCKKPDNCETSSVKSDQIKDFLGNQIKKKDNVIRLLKVSDEIDSGKIKKKITKINDDITLISSISSEVQYKENENTIYLTQKYYNDWFFFKDSNFQDIKIIFLGLDTNLDNSDSNKVQSVHDNFAFTGCLTIYNSEINNIDLEATNNSFCEDTINIVNSVGFINKIKIKNSFSDALDLDFSYLNINYIEIVNSNNDCLDVSWGVYDIKRITLQGCKDKAISVGENSMFQAEEINLKNSLNGLVVKDSSVASINILKQSNVEKCIDVFKKKPEFDNGFININKEFCNSN